ncbi:hypothetical protein [uncultured Helicobacter sp.]|uniref:hypothetical protein n=1 Tax=uncultured Helicobacter sp. TaxID=175537 RepID=UPI00374F47DA
MASNIASAAMWAAVFTPTADEIAKEIVAEEARLREIEEKAYWEAYWKAWDRAVKEGVIERLRDPNDTLQFFPKTYPDISRAMWADLIERGEVQLLAPTKETTGFGVMWADENREEAQHPNYKEALLKFDVAKAIKNGSYRIIS